MSVMAYVSACELTGPVSLSLLDDLEVALHLPVGDGLAEFALLPFAGGGVVLDEGVAEQGARRPSTP